MQKVTDAVHDQGGFIYAQLWALGRAAKGDVLKAEYGPEGTVEVLREGEDVGVVSSSDIPFEGGDTPRALKEEEIRRFIGEYATAAKNAVEKGGFDGVEIHGANGM